MGIRDPSVVVVGAGMGGLACAVDLASSGFRVRLLEAADEPGGKARALTVEGREVDAGPTVLTMPWVFDELFAAAGRSFRSELGIERASVLARHTWPDGARLDLHADPAASADAIGTAFGAAEARAYLAFCEDTRRIYAIAEEPFLRSQRLTLTSIVGRFGAAGLGALAKLDSHRTMWQALTDRFADARLQQLFGRYATYCGSSPFEAPGTLNLVAHVESLGVFRVDGGIHALARALARLARELGVEVLCGTPAERIVVERGRAVGVEARGGYYPADIVVFAGDVSALAEGRLGERAGRGTGATPRDARSLSAVTWAGLAAPTGFPLLHHNVFFGPSYRAEFDAIFRHSRVPAEPTVYVCAQDRGDAEAAPALERVLVIVNAPPTGDTPASWGEAERERCTRAMESVLGRAGLTLRATHAVQTTPADFHARFPATGGALYGPRSKGSRSVLARAGAATKVPGLYLAGGSVHPGPGVPMSALSGRLAAARIREDHASTARSRTAATAGTT